MEYKLVTKKDLNEFFPNNYDLNTLKDYELFTDDYMEEYLKLYSVYRYVLDKYLEKVLNLEDIDSKIKELHIGFETYYFYKNISNFKNTYVYLRNNVFLERLTKEELTELKDLVSKNNDSSLEDFVKKTYKKLIMFDIHASNEKVVNYNSYGGFIVYNSSLVLGVFASRSNELLKYLKEKELEYTSILGIPVAIFLYEDIVDESIYLVKDIYEKNLAMRDDILKKYPKYLPLGSIVELKDSYQKIMIMGYSQLDMQDKTKTYDYIACLYPDGMINNKLNILFNHEDIKKIYALGLVDGETKKFLENIDNLIGK